MQVSVYSALAARLALDDDSICCEWSGSVPIVDPEEAYRFFNRISTEDASRLATVGYSLPSMSVGDLVTIEGVTFLCATAGFRQVDSETISRVKSDPWAGYLVGFLDQ